jgi:lipoprotein-anchoring transpeptidase ErfK/SrfK
MHIANAARVAVFGAVTLFAAYSANAVPRTYYDVQAHKWTTYDPDKLHGDATGAATAAPHTEIANRHNQPDKKFDRQEVAYDTPEKPGTVIIDTKNKFLYYVEEGGKALRMGVGVGREGFGWAGTVQIGNKQENPKWFPPPEMVERQPELAKYDKVGMPGGEGNPLGVRALYLYDEKGKDTLFRIHGTIEPWSIGLNVSSGCIRMLNENVTALYDLVEVGTKVIVI